MKHLSSFEKLKLNSDLLKYSRSKASLQKIKHLIEEGADVNSKDVSGDTPLYYAVINIFHNCVKLLIENGADVNNQNNEGFSPLLASLSVMSYNFRRNKETYCKIIDILIENGADMNLKNKSGHDVFDVRNEDIKKYIIDKFPIQYENYLIKKNVSKYNL